MEEEKKGVFERHERIALQFSGGKDSLAVLHLLREHWPRLTVYWLDSGDAFPETQTLMDEVKAMVPHFEVIEGRQPAMIAEFGIPSDMVPIDSTPMGFMARGGHGVLMQDRYSCCIRSRLMPMHDRMVADGITLIIRGQKNSDPLRGPLTSGAVDNGIEYLFPIEDWDDAQVLEYLADEGIDLPAFYPELQSSPECMTCSAYWEEQRGPYLKAKHPGAYQVYQERLRDIAAATAESIANFNAEIEG